MKFDNKTLKIAVKEWLENKNKVESKYGHISNWDTSSVTDMSNLFAQEYNPTIDIIEFNDDIGRWDTSNVTDMRYMFFNCKEFNQDISSWDTSNVKNMLGMFCMSESFNQDIGKWNVCKVKNMSDMFSGASSFEKDLSNWDISNVIEMENMFFDTNYVYGELLGENVYEIDEFDIFGIFLIMEKTIFNFGDKKKLETFKLNFGISNTEIDAEIIPNFIDVKEDEDYNDFNNSLLEKIKKELKCKYLIFIEDENKDGKKDYLRIVDLPKITDYSRLGIDFNFKPKGYKLKSKYHEEKGLFSTFEELINYLKKMKKISFKELDLFNRNKSSKSIKKEYHENGNIKEETEVNSKGFRHGLKKIYHENGQLQVQVEFTNGKQNDGEIISFHDNGNKARCVNLSDGNYEGDFIEWHKNGVISRKGVYENDEIVEEQLWDEDKNPMDKKNEVIEQYKIKDDNPSSIGSGISESMLFKRDITGLMSYFEERPNMERLFNELTHFTRDGYTVEEYLENTNFMDDDEVKTIIGYGFIDISGFLEDMLKIQENSELKKDYESCLKVSEILLK